MTRSLIATLIVFAASTANAQIDNCRQLDELAFSAFVEAREVRWMIHDNFVDSRDYDHLLRDATGLTEALMDLQRNLGRDRPEAILCRNVDVAIREAQNLRSHLDGCDFARVQHRSRRTTFRGNGYTFQPETRHAGHFQVRRVVQQLDNIERTLATLDTMVHGGQGGFGGVGTPPPPAPTPSRPTLLTPENAMMLLRQLQR